LIRLAASIKLCQPLMAPIMSPLMKYRCTKG
jgi:hypothetical protein